MATRQGLIEDLMDFGLKVPPRVGIALAAISWMILHVVAAQTVVVAGNVRSGDFASIAQQSFIHIIAMLLQYVIPFCLLIGVLASSIRRWRARRVLASSQSNPKTAIASMTWRDFERLVGESFRCQGFEVVELGGTGPDGGVDLVLKKEGKRFLAQCKHWKAWQVGVSVVRELNGVIAAQKADGGYVITGGQFTHDARVFANSCGLILIEGAKLEKWIKNASDSDVCLTPETVEIRSCPDCGSLMAKKIPVRGQFKGQPFWSCTTYPKCRGKIHIERVT